MAGRRAKGEGSLRKRSDGRWEGRYTAGRDPETGKVIYRNVLAKTQSECKAKLREAIRALDQSDHQLPEKAESLSNHTRQYTLEEWLRTWYELYSKPNLRETTQEYYSNFIENHLIPHLGKTQLDRLTGLQLQKFYRELRESGKVHQYSKGKNPGLSPKTIRGIHMVLHIALEQAVKEKLIASNPTNDCTPPRNEKKEMNILRPEQIKDYLQAAEKFNVLPMFFLELTSGLRRGELLALLWTDLNIEKRTITVNKSVLGRRGELKVTAPKTSHSIRKVTIPQQAVDLLIQEHSLHPDNPFMFPSPITGDMYHPDSAGRIHKKILKEAGIDHVRFHDLRHTFATIALQSGVDVKTLSNMLGHFSSGFTLDTYTHVTEKMQQDAAEKMENFMQMTL